MKIIIFISALLFSIITFSQETKKISDKKNDQRTEEIYYVLKSDEEIKHGVYTFLRGGFVEIEGQYLNGEKTGEWIEYDGNKNKDIHKKYNYNNGKLEGEYAEYNYKGIKVKGYYSAGLKHGMWEYYDSGKVYEKGNYSNDTMTGIWEYYNEKKLIIKFDYDSHKYIYDAQNVYGDRSVADSVYLPIYISGIKNLYRFIGSELVYPKIARENGIAGTVYCELTIDINGGVKRIMVTRGIGASCENECVRVLSLTSGRWFPATKNGQPVESIYKIPIKFSLQ